jgi:hypothetical protein
MDTLARILSRPFALLGDLAGCAAIFFTLWLLLCADHVFGG